MLGDVKIGENSWNEAFERAKEKRDSLLEMDKFENKLSENEIEMKAMTRCLVDPERTRICQNAKKFLLMQMK